MYSYVKGKLSQCQENVSSLRLQYFGLLHSVSPLLPSSLAKGFRSTPLPLGSWGAEWNENPWLAKMLYYSSNCIKNLQTIFFFNPKSIKNEDTIHNLLISENNKKKVKCENVSLK